MFSVDLRVEAVVARCIAALVVQSGAFQVIDVAAIDEAVVTHVGARLRATPGAVADTMVSELHRDVEALTVRRLADLALGFSQELRRFNLAQVAIALESSVEKDWIPLRELPGGMWEKVVARRRRDLD